VFFVCLSSLSQEAPERAIIPEYLHNDAPSGGGNAITSPNLFWHGIT
jgi:hypothetical protein